MRILDGMSYKTVPKMLRLAPSCIFSLLRHFALPLLCALCAFSLCACAKAYNSFEEARAQNAVLPANTVIDGLSLGGKSMEEALSLLEAHHAALQEATTYTLSAGEDTLRVSAAELPFTWNSKEVLLQAASIPWWQSERELQCQMQLGAEACRAALDALTAPLAKAAQDASFAYEDGRFQYTREKSGAQVELVDLAEKLRALAPGSSYKLEVIQKEIKPAYTLAQAEADTALLGSFSTSFAGSTYGVKNRVHNICKAAALIDGVCLAPGESFDMNAILGPRNEENGWREANAIREGAYVQEYGGGVCQVSTTLYNAILLADLDVTERHHHSWPLGYVSIGRDATISTGGPNFKFVNTMQTPIYISALTDTEEKTVSVRIYGRARSDGVTIKLRSEKVESIADPGDEVRVDRSLAPGQKERQRKSRAGSISETYRLYYGSDGTLLREELVSRDKYRAIKGILLVSSQKKEEAAAAWSPFAG